MKPPSEHALLTLQRYREAASLRADERARVGALLHERVARGDLPRFDVQPSVPRVPPTSLTQQLLASSAVKLGAVVVVLGALAGAGYALHGTATDAPTHVELAPRPLQPRIAVLAAEPAAPALAAPSDNVTPTLAPKPATAATAPVSVAKAPGSAATIDGEVQLMNDAQAALRAGDSKRALALLGEHASRYPAGKLTTLRQVTRMLALCQSGRAGAAQAEAAAFLAKNPSSPFSERVSHICSK